jgi:hypothetical protein
MNVLAVKIKPVRANRPENSPWREERNLSSKNRSVQNRKRMKNKHSNNTDLIVIYYIQLYLG